MILEGHEDLPKDPTSVIKLFKRMWCLGSLNLDGGGPTPPEIATYVICGDVICGVLVPVFCPFTICSMLPAAFFLVLLWHLEAGLGILLSGSVLVWW